MFGDPFLCVIMPFYCVRVSNPFMRRDNCREKITIKHRKTSLGVPGVWPFYLKQLNHKEKIKVAFSIECVTEIGILHQIQLNLFSFKNYLIEKQCQTPGPLSEVLRYINNCEQRSKTFS